MSFKTSISEVFVSSQGEGEWVGYRQVFIRLAGCPFDCPYCDTEKHAGPFFTVAGEKFKNMADSRELADILIAKFGKGDDFHSYSFTGGEPLLNPDFVYDCAGALKEKSEAKLFLETSGLLPDAIGKADGIFDMLSVDIKAHSFKAMKNMPFLFSVLKSMKKSDWYLKFMLEEKNTDSVIREVTDNLKKFGINKLIIQPVDNKISAETADKVFKILYKNGIEGRLIPQTHKMLFLP